MATQMLTQAIKIHILQHWALLGCNRANSLGLEELQKCNNQRNRFKILLIRMILMTNLNLMNFRINKISKKMICLMVMMIYSFKALKRSIKKLIMCQISKSKSSTKTNKLHLNLGVKEISLK